MFKGTVKSFNESKGFGCIIDSVSGEEILVYVTGLMDDIKAGDTVTYDKGKGKRDCEAVHVRLA